MSIQSFENRFKFSYPDKKFPQELLGKKKTLTIQGERAREKDFRLKEFVPMEYLTRGKAREGQMRFWRKIVGGETERLKYFSTYALTQEIAELLKNDK